MPLPEPALRAGFGLRVADQEPTKEEDRKESPRILGITLPLSHVTWAALFLTSEDGVHPSSRPTCTSRHILSPDPVPFPGRETIWVLVLLGGEGEGGAGPQKSTGNKRQAWEKPNT